MCAKGYVGGLWEGGASLFYNVGITCKKRKRQTFLGLKRIVQMHVIPGKQHVSFHHRTRGEGFDFLRQRVYDGGESPATWVVRRVVG